MAMPLLRKTWLPGRKGKRLYASRFGKAYFNIWVEEIPLDKEKSLVVTSDDSKIVL
jgi:hypothetical protein